MRVLSHLRREDGISLMELNITMALLGVLFAAFALVIGSVIRLGGEVEANSNLQTEVRAAVDTMAAELRQAYTGSDTDAPIESMSASEVVFDTPDRKTPFHVRRVGYRAISGRLEHREAISTDTDGHPWILTAYATAPWRQKFQSLQSTSVFTYKKSDGGTATTVGEIESIGISVTVATATAPNRPYTYRTSVTLRTPLPPP
jgi:type II secretory pathway component PulJ